MDELPVRPGEAPASPTPRPLPAAPHRAASSPPGAPHSLRISRSGERAVDLTWEPPSPLVGGPANGYLIEKRMTEARSVDFGKWIEVGASFETHIILTDQRPGVPLQFRVVAINTTGASPPSHIVTITL